MRQRYGNTFTVVDGIKFRSKRESIYYSHFKLEERAGKISELELQPRFPIVIDGKKVCVVVLDFAFKENGRKRILDIKGCDNAHSKLKRKLVEAVHGITVEIVK